MPSTNVPRNKRSQPHAPAYELGITPPDTRRARAEEAVHERNQDAEHHQSQGSGVDREQEAEYGRAYCSAHDRPFPFIPFRDGAPKQGANRKGEGDEK